MCAVNEGVRETSLKRSGGDEGRTTGVNGVQGRCRVTDVGWRFDFSERSLPDAADRLQRSDRCFQCPLLFYIGKIREEV